MSGVKGKAVEGGCGKKTGQRRMELERKAFTVMKGDI